MMLSRRNFLLSSLLGLLVSRMTEAGIGRELNFGLTPVILNERQKLLQQWGDWMAQHLLHDIRFFQRTKYREIMALLLNGKLDLAWVCGYPYVREKEKVQLLVVPVYLGKPNYHSLIITGSSNAAIKSFADLKNEVFAFSDPDSNSGYLYPSYRLQQINTTPGRFFSRSFFTWSHQNTIEAVAVGLAQGGSVDSYVWDQMKILQPDLVSQTRVIEQSPAFGFPPLVTRKNIDPTLFGLLQNLFLNMDKSSEGKQILQSLGLDGFKITSPHLFDSIDAMMHEVS
jgi:phosphonate transport system substrate-binding protein